MEDARTTYELLSSINVNDHKKKKGKFDYLSWTWAIDAVQRSGCDFNYELLDDVTFADGTMEVRCRVSINGLGHTMWLAVADHNNKAIVKPNAAEVNKARMRCLVKGIAIHGLGFYIYAGEDLPSTVQEVYDDFMGEVENNPYDCALKYVAMSEEDQIALSQSAPAGHKVALKAKLRELSNMVHETADKSSARLLEQAEAQDSSGVVETWEELADIEKTLVWARVTPELKTIISEMIKEQRNAQD
jgi:hypothetical protein